jgi:hypothetical protein
LDPRFTDLNPAEGYGFLWAIKVRSTNFFGGEAKPAVSRRSILLQFKEPYGMKEILLGQIQRPFFPKFLPAALLLVSTDYCQRSLVGKSRMIRIQTGSIIHQ